MRNKIRADDISNASPVGFYGRRFPAYAQKRSARNGLAVKFRQGPFGKLPYFTLPAFGLYFYNRQRKGADKYHHKKRTDKAG